MPPVSNLTHTWTGWDGSVWPLLAESGAWLDKAGIRGMGMPDITHFKRQPVSINGSVWYGYVIPEREVFWPLHIAFSEEQDRAFWRTMLPYQTGTWTVEAPSGQTRSLDLRFTDDGQWAPDTNPFLTKIATYGLTLAAEQPLWRGEPIFEGWGPPENFLFFGGGDPSDPSAVTAQAGPPFAISPSSSFNNAQIVNDGDVETWPLWVIDGPSELVTVGVGTDTIEVPVSVADGQRLTIDTSPAVQQALLGDPDPDDPSRLVGVPTDCTSSLGSVTWSMIPPGGLVDVSITVTTGAPKSVGIQYTPLYLRAW